MSKIKYEDMKKRVKKEEDKEKDDSVFWKQQG